MHNAAGTEQAIELLRAASRTRYWVRGEEGSPRSVCRSVGTIRQIPQGGPQHGEQVVDRGPGLEFVGPSSWAGAVAERLAASIFIFITFSAVIVRQTTELSRKALLLKRPRQATLVPRNQLTAESSSYWPVDASSSSSGSELAPALPKGYGLGLLSWHNILNMTAGTSLTVSSQLPLRSLEDMSCISS